MNIEIIAIGNEVLEGFTVNSNAAYISQGLLFEGLRVVRHTALPDEANALEAGFREALARSQLIISTGGLGPTCDDNTRQIVAKIFDSPFRFDEEVAADIKRR